MVLLKTWFLSNGNKALPNHSNLNGFSGPMFRLSFILLNKTVEWRPNGVITYVRNLVVTRSFTTLVQCFGKTVELTFVFGLLGEPNPLRKKHLMTWCLFTCPRLATVFKILLITHIFPYFRSVRFRHFSTFWTPLFYWNMNNECLVFYPSQ